VIWLLRSIEKGVPDIALALEPYPAPSITYQEFFRAKADKSPLFPTRVELANSKSGDTTLLKISRYRRYSPVLTLHRQQVKSSLQLTPNVLLTD
jgi:hypothetical protein